MEVRQLASEMDAMVGKGQIVEAVEKFFADNAKTHDTGGSATSTKAAKVDFLKGFTGGIAKVTGLTLLHATSNADVSMSEYNINLEMKDGSHILWHEIIRREWKNGKVVDEAYFKN